MKKMAQEIKMSPRISSKELVDFLFEQPYCKIRFWSAVTWQKRGLLQNTRANFTKEDF